MKGCALIILYLLFSRDVLAFDNFPITYLGIENGLSNNSVRCIYQDHNGFMWFGTYDGLNRYDGYGFTVFRNKLNDSASLPHNYIYTIAEDKQYNLWIGTGQGIGVYNNLTSKFLPAFYTPYNTKERQKITVNVVGIKTDARGNIFIGTNGWGLLFQPPGADAAAQILCKKEGQRTGGYTVQAIGIDKRQQVWLFIQDVGLCLFNYRTKEIQLVNNAQTSANCMEVDDSGNLWIGTTHGLYTYSIDGNAYIKTYNEESGKLTANNVACLSFDKQHNLWVGTEGGGINIIHPGTEKIDYLLPGENKNALGSESVFAIYMDNESRKWVGTLKGGVNMIDPKKDRFQTIVHDQSNRNSLINNFVSCFYEDNDTNLWIGTDGGGISLWNRRLNRFTNFKHEPGNSNSLSNNSVSSIVKDHLDNVWIATFGDGINRFNKSNHSFEHFKCVNSVTGEENKNAWLLYEDRNKDLWATTFGRGKFYRFNRQAQRFDMYDPGLTNLISLVEDHNGVLWGGDSHQLIKIDKQNKNHTFYEIGKPVRVIYEDKGGSLWIGAEGGGLILFDRAQGQIAARYSTDNGLCNNAVLNILEDSAGHLWLSTFNGLSEFNRGNKTFKNYYQDDGLQSNQFLYNAAFRLQTGELVFGGIKGFNIFFPGGNLAPGNPPPVILTGLRVNNKPVSSDNAYVTKVNGDNIEALKLPFNAAVLSFDFAALEYTSPGKILYAYYLQGWDKNWNYTGNLRTANYTFLSEGNYVLRIKATNAEGVWNTREVRLQVAVLPPWYRSWWAYVLYSIVIISGIFLYQRYRARQAKLEYEVSLAKLNAEKERAELEKTQAQYETEKLERKTERMLNEKEKEINEKRHSFFTNISHEFRTPLTLIINPIKDMLNNHEESEESRELKIVYRNARRLLSLVNQLLLFRKADTEGDVLTIARVNFSNLCREVYLSFTQQAKAKRITYEFECVNEGIQVHADKEKIEIALFNLLSNALKYTQDGGTIRFRVQDDEREVTVDMIDNGPGIPGDVGDKLFDKFYRVQPEGSSLKAGFGIGLYLVKNFVESHNGEISYTSEPGKGTSFTMKLPKGTTVAGTGPATDPEKGDSFMLQELVEEPMVQPDKNPLDVLISDKQSMLLVDDDAQLRQYIAGIFQHRFLIYEAANGEEGYKIAYQNTPDIILLDISMEGMNGIQLCKSIKETPSLSHIPVILLTGTSSTETKLQGIELGADDYITKPFEREILYARVSNILKSRHVLHDHFYNDITLHNRTLKVSEEDKAFMETCMKTVEKHFNDPQFTIQTLASEIGMSHSNLYQKIKSISGQSVNGFIRFIRLRKAAELFIITDCNVNEAAFQVGMNDHKYFREQFNKLFGMNPSEFIKKFRKPFNKSFTLSDMALKNGKNPRNP